MQQNLMNFKKCIVGYLQMFIPSSTIFVF